MKKDVKKFVNSCHTCQLIGKPNQVIPKAPLIKIPIVGEPFEEIVVDVVGPLPRSKKGNQFILTIIDRMSRYPEGIPLRNVKAKTIVECLICFFTRFGLPKVIQTDNGSYFKGNYFKEHISSLGIKHYTSTPYHPESQDVVERMHQTLKSILKKMSIDEVTRWDEKLPYALFALRAATNESVGFSPFNLVFGHKVRDLSIA